MSADPPQSEPRAADEARPPVVVVTGPTASGKSALAIALAERFDGEIVNADSMQVFRYMDIGTAKPTPEERLTVPHHLFDVATPTSPTARAATARKRAPSPRRSTEEGVSPS